MILFEKEEKMMQNKNKRFSTENLTVTIHSSLFTLHLSTPEVRS